MHRLVQCIGLYAAGNRKLSARKRRSIADPEPPSTSSWAVSTLVYTDEPHCKFSLSDIIIIIACHWLSCEEPMGVCSCCLYRCPAVAAESDIRSLFYTTISVVSCHLAAPTSAAGPASRQQPSSSQHPPSPSPRHSTHSATVRQLTILWQSTMTITRFAWDAHKSLYHDHTLCSII